MFPALAYVPESIDPVIGIASWRRVLVVLTSLLVSVLKVVAMVVTF
tara:strand:- start:685 stop:822 length:138 start_codon:yes stop_codon:yes gene_type:complete